MSPPAPSERVGSFLHAIRSSPVAELREVLARAEAQSREGRLPRATIALSDVDAIARRRGLLPVIREVEDTARRTVDPLLQHANHRPDELPLREATAIQLLVEWAAVAIAVAEDLSEASFMALWEPFAPVLARRLQDAREANDDASGS